MFQRPYFFLVAVAIALLSSPAVADKRIALVVGNSAYKNVSVLENPANDARLMAETLRDLGFALVGGNAQLDLDKAGFDRVVQDFGAQLQGANVGLFYYAGHGIQVRGANYLVPVGANPVREADIDFQMLDTNLVLRQMESSGTRLNLVILDACRNNPFGGRGLRSSSAGLAQIQAPEGTLISFATQPGSVALDGHDGNSPYTRALAKTLRRGGLDVFQTFNEVGLAVKQATAGSQQPWVSSSPISGSFYFSALPELNAAAPSLPTTDAERAWQALGNTTSLAIIEAFIEQYGDSLYGRFARARRDELKRNQVAAVSPLPAVAPKPPEARTTRADVTKTFELFNTVLQRIRTDYVEPLDETKFISAATTAMRETSPAAQKLAGLGSSAPSARNAAGSAGKLDINAIYDTAVDVLNQGTSQPAAALVETAVNAAIASLDPHSSYMSAKAFSEMQTQTSGQFGGVGLEVTMEDGLVKVVAPIDGAPADKAGVRGGDVITHLDGEPVLGLTLNDAVQKMRGAVNTSVRLRIARKSQDAPVEIAVTREIIRVRAVRSRLEGDDVGYIRITTFNQQTLESVKRAVSEIGSQVTGGKLKGYVIDLRNNPGGLLDQVVAISDEFLERGEVVSTRARKAENVQRFSAKPGDLAKGKRLVVLINGGTASGAEIMAGALQDNKRATLIGSRSFGKGSLQTIIPLSAGNGALRLTTALYFTPSGRSIQASGIAPDIEILQDVPEPLKDKAATGGEAGLQNHLKGRGNEQGGSQAYVPPDPANDKALIRAVQVLRSK